MLYKELNDGLDIHADNQKKFGLPDRLIAKIFKFRLLYGASEYGFANDPDFYVVSDKPKFWKKVIDNYYTKYSGIHAWHNKLLTNVADTGKMITPFGREFEFDCFYDGEFKLPATIIKNYPVNKIAA